MNALVVAQARTVQPRVSRCRTAMLLVVGLIVFASMYVVQSYIHYKYPIKADRYHHAFRDHVADRTIAYLRLFRSPSRSANLGMSIEAIQRIVNDTSARHGIDPCLIMSVVAFESGFNPNTITTTGAMGLMAIQPSTAQMLGIGDPFDSQQNVDGGTRLLKELSATFNGNTSLVLAGYNAGPNAVKRYNGVPPFRETADYVHQVGRIYRLCAADSGLILPAHGGNIAGSK